ncbi:hypothetical protein [Labrys sp. WJW]|nr:hypothetical protein [Labrys sp. WJW]
MEEQKLAMQLRVRNGAIENQTVKRILASTDEAVRAARGLIMSQC